MAQIKITDLQKRYDNVEVLRHINLTIHDGEFVVLVGPSGCGKSTLLRTIAGLETASSGDIHIGSRLMNQVAPKDRDISMVFQSYALYPHMTVARNMGFSLEVQKKPKAEIDAAVNKAAEILGLTALLQRRPKELSGGQRQRVAMGRAIVREPQVFLFDEPLSNLDAQLRGQMRIEIKSLHQRMKNTIVYVTHDQVEAMTLADRIVVLNHGLIQQVGTPLELYDTPANRFVASFIGSPAMNFIDGKLERHEKGCGVRINNQLLLPVDEQYGDLAAGRDVTYGIRPEALELCQHNESGALPLDITLIEPTGLSELIHGKIAGEAVSVYSMVRSGAGPGGRVWVRLDASRMQLFDRDSQQRIIKTGERANDRAA